MSIPEIISQRKQFVSNTYQFYTQHALLLDEIKESIIEQIELDLEEEVKVWNRWQKKVLRLNHFNSEIQEWMKSQKNKDINQKRIIEISYLKSSFENQAETSKKHYSIFIGELENKRKKWVEEMALYLVRTINQNSQHKSFKKEVDENVVELLEYSKSWNKPIIHNILGIINDSKSIIEFCETIIDDIESAKSTESVDMLTSDSHINQISSMKNSAVSNNCMELSEKLNKFQSTYNFEAISVKLNINYITLRESFVDLFSDSSMSGLRASIKIIKKLNHTKAQIEKVIKKMYEINELFKPHYTSLITRKQKMIQLCVNTQKLEENTAFKWIEANISDIFAPLDKKINNLKQSSQP